MIETKELRKEWDDEAEWTSFQVDDAGVTIGVGLREWSDEQERLTLYVEQGEATLNLAVFAHDKAGYVAINALSRMLDETCRFVRQAAVHQLQTWADGTQHRTPAGEPVPRIKLGRSDWGTILSGLACLADNVRGDGSDHIDSLAESIRIDLEESEDSE